MKIRLIIILMLCVGFSTHASFAIGESLPNSAETDNEYIRNLIKSLDVTAKSTPDAALIEKSRKIQNWAVKQGTGDTLDELRKEKMIGIEAAELNAGFLNSKHEVNITYISSYSESQILHAIENLMQKKGHPVNIERVFTGPFTSVGSLEAIVQLTYVDLPHHESTQIWAFQYDNNKWINPGQLSKGGFTEAIPIDADGDGVNEVMLYTSTMSQGYASTSIILIKIVYQTKYMVIFESHSEDNTGTANHGAKIKHEILSFDDIDGDGRKELLATKVNGFGSYNLTKKCSDNDKKEVFDVESNKHIKVCRNDNYKITYSEIVTTIYKLKGSKYDRRRQWKQTAIVSGSETNRFVPKHK